MCWGSQRLNENIRSLGPRVQVVSYITYWDSNSAPLKEKQMLFINHLAISPAPRTNKSDAVPKV